MKKTILTAMVFGLGTVMAQDLETAQRQFNSENYQSAEASLHSLLKQDPGNAAAWYGLTNAYLMQDEMTKASDSLKLAPPSVQQEPFYQAATGYLALSSGDRATADANFNKALDETRQKDADILAAIARAHIESATGDARYAISLLDKAIKRDKKNPALHILKGDAYRKLNDGSEAYKAYKEALELDGNNAVANHKIGEIFVTQQNPEVYLEYFNKALQADPGYAPTLYRMYAHYFIKDPVKAMQYFKQYAQKADPSLEHQYDLVDLLYLNKHYKEALQKANALASSAKEPKARIYKLMAHSHLALKDTAAAITSLQQYLQKEADSNLLANDLATMGDLYASAGSDSARLEMAMDFYRNALKREKDSAHLYAYYKKLADAEKLQKDYAAQADWLARYYNGNQQATNIDLFYWGVAHYQAGEYNEADSVFGLYTEKYPEQSFGYYWRARINSARDKDMAEGLALPHYQKLVDVLSKDTANTNYKNWMVEAYGYMAAYEANKEKDFQEAVDYFEKVLEVDPANEEARKYIAVLEKSIPQNSN